jgi:hypothetical protein
LAAVLVVLTALLPNTGLAAEQKTQTVQLLFVQNAKAMVFDKGTITLKGVSPTTLFFSDRPIRIAGHYTTEEFVQMWGEGKDSFSADPPNATLSIFQKDRDKLMDVVVKLSNPQLKGDDLTYHVAILEGQMPAQGGICSLFIDIIGMPFTPLSYAGVARRWTRRAVFAGAAATSVAAAATIAAHPTTVVVEQPAPPPTTVVVTHPAPPPTTVIVTHPAPAPAAAPSLQTAEQKLRDLKALFDQGLISQSDYDAKKQQILKGF